MNYETFIIPALTVLSGLLGIAFFGWFRIVKETNNLLRSQNDELKRAYKDLDKKHHQNVALLASMQGQIDILKSIPLVNIDTTLQEIAKFNGALADTNQRILETLEKSADKLSAEKGNGGLLVKTKKTKPLDVKDIEE